jgi:hypothetical protein
VSTIRVEFAEAFMFGDDVVLLALDGDGVADFVSALESARREGRWELLHSGIHYEFSMEAGRSAVEVDGDRIVWRLDPAKASEILDAVNALGDRGRPSHQYVDIAEPANTLVLSLDEYTEHS